MAIGSRKNYDLLGVKECASTMAFFIVLSAAAQDSNVAGRVVDSHGQPVAGATVTGTQYLVSGGPKDLQVQTDANGQYNLTAVGELLFFRKAGYRPLTYKRVANESTANVTLPFEDSGWEVPRCTDQQRRQHSRYGDTLLFLAPRSAHAMKGEPDTDNRRVFLSFPKDRKAQMIIWSGPLIGGGFGFIAPKKWYADASSIVERGDSSSGAIDARGTTRDGHHWRSISWMTDIVWYHDVSDEAAQFFDKIIDTACLRTP